jgi:hypothetical protein
VNLSSKIARVVSSLRRQGVWVGLALVLAGPLVLSGDRLLGQEARAARKQAKEAPSLTGAEMVFRGAEAPSAGQRFTLEVLILNTGSTPLTDLEFHAKLDDNLDQPSREREHRVAVDAIAPDDLHIVRLPLTSRKAGTGELKITLRAKDGAMQQVSYVMPIAAESPRSAEQKPAAPPRKVKVAGTFRDGEELLEQKPALAPLQVKVTPLKECIVDRPSIVLVNVRNADLKPMPKSLELMVLYSSISRGNTVSGGQFGGGSFAGQFGGGALGQFGQLGGGGFGGFATAFRNPTRTTQVSLPALESGQSITLPVRLTPRRIGDLGIDISVKGAPNPQLASTRLSVRFDPQVAIDRLLPARAGAAVPTRLPRTLAEVPEVSLEDPPVKALAADEAFEHVAHLIEKINHVNQTKADAYMEALTQYRSDLRGMPFTLGDECRLPTERGQLFQDALNRLRAVARVNPATVESLWPDAPTQSEPEPVIKARIAALVQVIEPEGTRLGKLMVKYLASLSHGDATRALARFAISADDAEVRAAAVAALATRRDQDYGEILANGLKYPWPAVAQRSADAIVTLKRTDLLPQLVDTLDRPDPRAPQTTEKDGKPVHSIRELVRVNHLRNCLLCHSPAPTVTVAKAIPVPVNGATESAERERADASLSTGKRLPANSPLTAPTPLPNQALPTPSSSGGYGSFTVPDTLIAFDVTYLRQDFSVKLPVADAKPWPEQQRFDFLVRTRELTEQDAQSYGKLFAPTSTDDLSTYQRAAVTALRQLTGRDAAPTAAAWRKVLTQLKTESN